ncbi:MAG: hypothetical protein JKY54_11245 [Flavobacteriales bacterium]|nr:hypothetical protein [Flavobacteriales bacterium]
MAAHLMDQYSTHINEAVSKMWMQNPVGDLVNSYNAFMRLDPLADLESMDKALIKDMAKALKKDPMEKIPKETEAQIHMIRHRAPQLQTRMKQVNNEVLARKNTIDKIQFSTDKMAGAGANFDHDGIIIEGDLVEGMNEIYDEELAKLTEKKFAVAPENTAFVKAVEANGQHNPESDTFTMNGATATVLMKGLSKEQQKTMDALAPHIDPDLKVVFGTPEALANFRGDDNPVTFKGQYDGNTKTLYIANMAPETLLHELVHATTYAKVFAHTTNQATHDAVYRIEALMDDFIVADHQYDDQATQDAVTATLKTIAGHLAKDTYEGHAAAINEFMAWSLTNQNLIDVASKTIVRNPLAKITKAVIRWMGRLVGADVFSNILFNTEIILQTPDADVKVPAPLLLDQTTHGANPENAERLKAVLTKWRSKVGNHLKNADPIDTIKGKDALKIARSLANDFAFAGFNMTMQERQTFTMIQTSLATEMEMDKLAMVRVEKLYTTVMKDGDLINKLTDEQFGVLTEETKDAQGNTNLMASFLALSQMNEGFRKILADMDVPKSLDIDKSSVDNLLNSTANSMMDALSITITGEGRNNKSIKDALDKLSHVLAEQETEAESYISLHTNGLLTKGDAVGSKILGSIAGAVTKYTEIGIAKTKSETVKSILLGADTITSMLDAERGGATAKTLVTLSNRSKIWTPIKEQLVEIIGMTDETKATLRIQDKVKYAVSGVRQDYRETLPAIFATKFSRKLTKRENKTLLFGLAKSDVAVLFKSMNIAQISDLFIKDGHLQNEIGRLESEVSTLVPTGLTKTYRSKAKQLANFMMGNGAGDHLLRNATAISKLSGIDVKTGPVSVKLEGKIDQLVTLYALDLMSKVDKEVMSELVTKERDGVDYMTAYLRGLRNDENLKAVAAAGKINGYKGFIPNEVQDGVSMIVANDSQGDDLVRMGYTRVGSYNGQDAGKTLRGYYYSAVSAKNTYSQGAMQTVQSSYNGVDPRSGKTVGGGTAGIITGTAAKYIKSRMNRTTSSSNIAQEALLPIFDDNGEVYAYERAMAPAMLNQLNKSDHLGDMIGAWAGRHAEEEMSIVYNEVLVDALRDRYKADQNTDNAEGYVNMADTSDKVYADSWKVVPIEMRDYIKEKFGDDRFMVREDMINNAIGHRNASVADAWTGTTRMNDVTKNAIVKTASFIAGDRAYKLLVTGERAVQTAVSAAKNTIVIRSVFVPAANMAANIVQLMNRGVPLPTIAKGMRVKLVEITAHLKNLRKEIELNADLATVGDDQFKRRNILAEIQSLKDSNQRMSIWPLIEAGAFSTISEGLTDMDESLVSGKFMDWVEGVVDTLPGAVKDIARYAIVSRDTALYQGMSRAVQYGDFLGKAIYYDHMVKAQKKTSDLALETIAEEFVNFNFLPGRTRTYAESMGLTWFWAFKIRAMKAGLRLARDNPLRSLMMVAGAPSIDLPVFGSPITDNFAAVVADDRIGYSVGWGMLFRSPSLNPWMNLMN